MVIVGVLMAVGRKRRSMLAEQRADEDREKAGELRAHAQAADLDAREKQASAARLAADADQAAVEAERLRVQAEHQRSAAAGDAARSRATYEEAATVDPDVDTPERAGRNADVGPAGVTSSYPAAEPVHDFGAAGEQVPAAGDNAAAVQEDRHGTRKEGL